MAAFMNDQDVAERILRHVKEKTTDVGDEVWREPVENYRSPERFERELQVLRRTPVPFCPSAALPESGSYLARSAAGTQIVAVRGEDGRVRAFRNACRHRGTPVASGSGCAKALVCPYHAWTYRLDGGLQYVPHEHGFPGLDKEAHGLVPVIADERLGLVFVTQDPSPDAPDSDAPEPEVPWHGLPELIGSEQRLLDTHDNQQEVNWKVTLEGAIEGYHIRSTHTKTFYPYGYDNLNVIEFSGRNSRVTYPFRRIEKLAEVPAEERRVEGRLTYVYHLFPNALVTVLSNHTILVVAQPETPDRTRMLAWALANVAGDDPDVLEEARRDANFVSQTGATEDLAVVLGIQSSIDSGANEFFTFGHFEPAIVHFHRNLRAALA